MKITKKILSLTLAMLMLISCIVFVGCEDEKDPAKELNQKKEIHDLSEEMILQMKYDYLLDADMGDVDPEDVVVDYYGGIYNDYTYNGRYYAYVVVMLDIIERSPEPNTKKVADIEINYPDSNRLIVWCNYTRNIYSLESAYAKKMISYTDLRKIVDDFHNNVTHFIDVCDVYDFEDKIKSATPTLNEDFSDTYVIVNLSSKLSRFDDLPLRYFGGDLVEEVIDITSSMEAELENYRKTLKLKLRVKTKKNVLYAINVLEEIPGIVRVYAMDMKSDIFDSVSFASTASTNSVTQWALDNMEVEKVWDFCTGSKNVRVGIIDSGVYNHSDISDNLCVGYDLVNGNSITTDDEKGHGTAIAGIIGAYNANENGMLGLNWDTSIVPLQIYAGLSPNIDKCIEAINRATESYQTDLPIQILNVSTSWVGESPTLKTAIENYPGLVVCSAGNTGKNIGIDYVYPGVYAQYLDNVIVVGAIDEENDRSFWYDDEGNSLGSSNYGSQNLSIYAPGSNIYSINNQNGYDNYNGTSYAVPNVVGVAALLLSVNPQLTAAQIKDCLLSGADSISIENNAGIAHDAKKLNAWGAFKYMMNTYIPSCTLGRIDTEIILETDRMSSYYLESHPTAKIVIPYSQTFTFSATGAGCKVDAVLYDSNMNPVSISKTWTNNQWTVNFTKELSAGTYYLSTYYTSTGTHDIDVTISHTHEYTDKYVYYSSQYHKCYCACGDNYTSLHVYRASDQNADDQFYTCISCGALMDTSIGGPGMIIHAIQKVSVNGSYILSDGTVFLVDEDIDAYFEGTLVFYDPDKLPQVE